MYTATTIICTIQRYVLVHTYLVIKVSVMLPIGEPGLRGRRDMRLLRYSVHT